jgi:hypothetical protein
MKPASLAVEKTTLDGVLKKVEQGQLVFLTKEGEVRFAVTTADDFDREVNALQNNAEFMDYLAACKKRAHSRPRKSLAEMRELYDKPEPRKETKKARRA